MTNKQFIQYAPLVGAIASFIWMFQLSSIESGELVDLQWNDESNRYEQVIEKDGLSPVYFAPPIILLLASITGFSGRMQIKKKPSKKKAVIPETQVSFREEEGFLGDELEEDTAIPATIITKEIEKVKAAIAQKQQPATSDYPGDPYGVFTSLYRAPTKHLMCVTQSGGGKTSLILGLMKYIHETTNSQAQFYVITTKEGNYLGVEDMIDEAGVPHYCCISSEDTNGCLVRARTIVKRVNKLMGDRAKANAEADRNGDPKPKFPPIILILDEVPSIVRKAREYDFFEAIFTGSTSTYEVIDKGREANVRGYFFGNDSQVQNFGINSGMKIGLGQLTLGRFYEEEDDDSGMTEIIDATTKAKRALIEGTLFSGAAEYWPAFEKLAQENLGRPIICISWRHPDKVVPAPYLPDIKTKRIFNIAPQPVEDSLDLDQEIADYPAIANTHVSTPV